MWQYVHVGVCVDPSITKCAPQLVQGKFSGACDIEASGADHSHQSPMSVLPSRCCVHDVPLGQPVPELESHGVAHFGEEPPYE